MQRAMPLRLLSLKQSNCLSMPFILNAVTAIPGLCLQARRPSSKQTPPAFRCHNCLTVAASQKGSGSPIRRSEWLLAARPQCKSCKS